MNILTDFLPDSVEIDGIEYPINTDFKGCLRVICAFESNELTNQEKQVILLKNLYPEIPHDAEQAMGKANWFLNGGNDDKGKEEVEKDLPRLFSFNKDANLIFAAFRQTHNIDLSTAKIHWFVFLSLFMDLGQDTTFCQLVGLRKRVKTGKASKEEREMAREMGDMFEVPEVDDRTLEDRDAEDQFMKLIEKGQRDRENQTK